MGFLWILAIASCLSCIELTLSESNPELVFAVFRHGNRAPTYIGPIYPNDPYIDRKYEPEGLGGLTNFGKMSVYKLGQFFLEKYGNLFGPVYTKDIIRFRADEIDRIVMTGQLVAAALFPPAKEQEWNSELLWQPIPVWAQNYSTDVLYNGMFCTNYIKLRYEVETTDEDLQIYRNSTAKLREYLSENAGSNITQVMTFILRQHLFAQEDLGLELPEWTKKVYPGELEDAAIFDLRIQSYTDDMKQLLGGQWIREWLNHVDNHFNESSTYRPKGYMYGAHEITIASILMALGSFDDQVPAYSSAVVFELHKEGDESFVRVIHKNNDDVRTLEIPGCDNQMCPLETFKNVVAPVLPEDPVALCGEIDFNVVDVSKMRPSSSRYKWRPEGFLKM